MKRIISILAVCLLFASLSLTNAETMKLGADRISFSPIASVTKTAAYTLTSSDSLVNVTAASADIVITLPTVSSTRATGSKTYKILKTDATSYVITVTPATGDTIGGESTRKLIGQNHYMVISTGPGDDWTIDFESPYVNEDHEAGTVNWGALASSDLTGDTVMIGTTPTLTMGDAGAEDTQINFDGNAVDFGFGLDDTADKLTLSKDTTLGTTNIMAIANTPTNITLHDASAADATLVLDGNAVDFGFGLDDSGDTFVLGKDGTLGTTPILTIVNTPSKITMHDASAADSTWVYDGNAQDFYLCLDDSADDLVFGLGATCGTTPAFAIDENQVTTWSGGTIKLTEITTTTDVLTSAECGKTIFLNSATEYQTTLPALSTAAAGCEFTFITKAAASAANYTVITGNTKEAKIYGSLEVAGAVVACAAEDTVTLVDGNAVGDWFKVVSDGTNWYIRGQATTSAKMTCTDEA